MPRYYGRKSRPKKASGYRRTYRKTTTYYRKRSYGRKRMYKPMNFRWNNPLPHTGYFKMKYNSITQVTGALSAVNNWTSAIAYNANSMYDPEAALGGGQPMAFDQYCSSTAPFNRYKVLASKIRIFIHNVNDNARAIRCSILPTLTATNTQEAFTVLSSMPRCRQFVLENQNDTRNKISNYCSTKKMWAVKDIDDAHFAAAYNANPNNMWYWQVVIDGSTQQLDQTVKFDVEIVYYCQLTQTAQVPPS